MPVNHADGTLFVSVIFYPFAAAKAGMEAQAGWITILVVAASILFGIAINYAGRKVIYAGMDLLLGKNPDDRSKWFQWLVGGPAFVAYMVLPYAIIGAGLYATWFGTIWAVRHLL
ncbi:MAG: hypothetical protein ACO1TE_11865 [Prosthecobacter sp.]